MPYALVIAGLILIVSGVRDTHEALGAQLKSDLTGDNNFARYALAIFAIGALGYIDKLRPASTAFMALVIISLVLSNKGVFNKLNDALKAGPETPPASNDNPASPLAAKDKLSLSTTALTILNPAAATATLFKYIGGKISQPATGN